MFRSVGLFVCVYVVLAAGDEELLTKCLTALRVNQDLLGCCTSRPKTGEKMKPEVVECLNKYPLPTSEADECIAKKLGYYGADGKLDMGAYTSHMEKKFEQNQEILGLIKENCWKADILNKGSPDTSDFTKMNLCVIKQLHDSCSEWSNEDHCNESKKEVNEACMAIYSY